MSTPLRVTVPTADALLRDLATRYRAGQGFCLATLNLDHVVKLRRDTAFRQAYQRMTHVTADGRPIVWLSRLAGRPVELVAGSDFVEPALAQAADLGVPVAFFGGQQATLTRAKEVLRQTYPDLQVVFLEAPSMGFDPEGAEADAAIAALKVSGARLCLVALGAPKQEHFAVRAFEALPQVGFLSIGASLDFIAGHQTRAPRLMRVFALEWLWRLAGDPKRMLGRYTACALLLPGLCLSALQQRWRGKAVSPS